MSGNALSKRKIVIIGGTTGIGLSAAKAFIREGAEVVMVGRNSDSADEARKTIGKKGIVLIGDAIYQATAIKAIEACKEGFGGFDGLYHIAGGSGRKMGDGPLHELTLDGWNKTLELNLTSLMLSNQAAINEFMKQKSGGVILNMGSVLGFSPSPVYFSTHAYAAAKAAIVGFSKSIAAFYAGQNIRINVIAPGLVETPMAQRAAKDRKIMKFIKTKQPLDGGRIGHAKDGDELAVYLLSDASRFVSGQVIAVDGGWSVSEGQY